MLRRGSLSVLAALAAMVAVNMLPTAVRAEGISYVCTALKQDAGRTDPEMTAPLYWWQDGRLRMVEKDQEVYYYDETPASDAVEWLDIYAVPNGHGNTFLGYYLKQHFNCREQ